jgi:isopenicillin-N N-acyltransferase-like protein
MVGQNQDLQESFEEQGIMLHMTPKRGPKMLCCTLAGSLGHNGINSEGMGWAANALDCGGWREGVPRYILFRRMLEQESVDEAIGDLRRAKRASSCNYMLAHASGVIADVETLVEGDGVLRPTEGFLAHANNYLCPHLTEYEKLLPQLPDSAIRAKRMSELLAENRGSLSAETMMELLRDHHNYPQSVCRHQLSDPDAEFGSMKTISSMVSRPASGVMHVAVGNPCQNEYHTYKL